MIFLYINVMTFNSFSSTIIIDLWLPKTNSVEENEQTAGKMMGIPYLLGSFLFPLFGLFYDSFGKRVYFLLLSTVLLLIAFACVSGVGMAVCFTTLMVLTMQKVPTQMHGSASGLCNTTYFFGGGVGLAVLSMTMNDNGGNKITQLPVVVLMMFAIAGVAGLLYFGGRNLVERERESPLRETLLEP